MKWLIFIPTPESKPYLPERLVWWLRRNYIMKNDALMLCERAPEAFGLIAVGLNRKLVPPTSFYWTSI